jgi:hypothetical protein
VNHGGGAILYRFGLLCFSCCFWFLYTELPLQAGTVYTKVSEVKNVSPSQYFLFYLHGKIIEDKGPEAVHPVFGRYDYHTITKTLADKGFVVISEVRSKNIPPQEYAQIVVKQVRNLLIKKVPPTHLTVVGASKGAGIAVIVSHLLNNEKIRYVLLAICNPHMIDTWQQNDICISGNVLSIFDYKDSMVGSCQSFFTRCQGKALQKYHEIELKLGSGHGFLYQPLPAWIEPTVAWAFDKKITDHKEKK